MMSGLDSYAVEHQCAPKYVKGGKRAENRLQLPSVEVREVRAAALG